MKITQKIIDDLEKALDMRKKNGDPVWDDGDEISVNVGGTFAADKFIAIHNRSKNPYVPTAPHPDFDYDPFRVSTQSGIHTIDLQELRK